MKVLAALIVFSLASLPTVAFSQPTSLPEMPCNTAAALVRAQGAIVLHTGPTTYSRFVSSGASCLRDQMPEPAWTPTNDNPQCFVGYRCRDTDLDNGR